MIIIMIMPILIMIIIILCNLILVKGMFRSTIGRAPQELELVTKCLMSDNSLIKLSLSAECRIV